MKCRLCHRETDFLVHGYCSNWQQELLDTLFRHQQQMAAIRSQCLNSILGIISSYSTSV